MFTGNVVCVYCRCQISFSGNDIYYQNQRCATHNQEHQFPGMNIIINKFNNLNISNSKNLPKSPPSESSSAPFKYPNFIKSRIATNPKTTDSQYCNEKSIITDDSPKNIRQNIPIPALWSNNLGNFLNYNVFSTMYDSKIRNKI